MGADDPFASPSTESPVAADAPSGRVRRLEQQIWRVASWLLFFGAAFVLWAAATFAERGPVASGLVALVIGGAQIAIGFELRRLSPRAWAWAIAAQLPVLPLFPVGTWVALRSAVTLLGEAGRVTLRPGYPVAPPRELGRPSPVVPLAGPPVIVLFVALVVWYFVL